MKKFILFPSVFILFFFISCSKDETTSPSSPTDTSAIVYITDTGNKYHVDGCIYLDKSKHTITVNEAKKQNYTACSVCKPPQ